MYSGGNCMMTAGAWRIAHVWDRLKGSETRSQGYIFAGERQKNEEWKGHLNKFPI